MSIAYQIPPHIVFQNNILHNCRVEILSCKNCRVGILPYRNCRVGILPYRNSAFDAYTCVPARELFYFVLLYLSCSRLLVCSDLDSRLSDWLLEHSVYGGYTDGGRIDQGVLFRLRLHGYTIPGFPHINHPLHLHLYLVFTGERINVTCSGVGQFNFQHLLVNSE